MGGKEAANRGRNRALKPERTRGHFVLAQLKVEYGQIFGHAIGIGGSRQGDHTILLDEPPEDDFRDPPCMVIGDLRDRGVRQHITAKAELACMA
jgi:hypothetical protein